MYYRYMYKCCIKCHYYVQKFKNIYCLGNSMFIVSFKYFRGLLLKYVLK